MEVGVLGVGGKFRNLNGAELEDYIKKLEGFDPKNQMV